MTLKEKLRHSLTGHLSDEKTEVDVNIAEKIAEEFAIGFAEWLIKNYDGIKSVKEQLNHFKKERGL